MEQEEDQDFSEILEEVLGLGKISREKFFEILKMRNKNNISSQEFLKLLNIIEQQE